VKPIKTFSIALLALGAIAHLNASPIPVVEYTTTLTANDGRPFTLGYSFTTTVPFSIDALAYWDDGLANNHQVGIWDSGGTLLVSTTVLGTDTLFGHFRYGSISPYLLGPGSYVIGGEFLGNGDPFPSDPSGLLTLPGYTWGSDLQLFGSGLNFPTVDTSGGYGTNGILVVTFSAGSAEVPEPSTWAFMITGLTLFAARRFRKAS
jgi:hypothetical protein